MIQLSEIDNKCKMNSPLVIDTNHGEIFIQQVSNGIFEASWKGLSQARGTASAATTALINTIQNHKQSFND